MEIPGLNLKNINWWKVGFISLFITSFVIIEILRETIVLMMDDTDLIYVSSKTVRGEPYTYISAEGVWSRVDGGDPVSPVKVNIKCYIEEKSCLVSELTWDKGIPYMWGPYMYDAIFTPDGVTYVNNSPICVETIVKIYLKEQRATATRIPKSKKTNRDVCGIVENPITMELSGWSSQYREYREREARYINNNNLPIFKIFRQ